MSLELYVITPSQTLWNTTADEVILPTTSGAIGILSGHVSLMAILDIGVMRIYFEKAWIPIYVTGGFAKIENDQVIVIANEAERGDRINAAQAKAEIESAETALESAENKAKKWLAQQGLRKAKARAIAASDFPEKPPVDLPKLSKKAPENIAVSALESLQML